MRISLRQLEMIIAIAEEGSMRSAATRLHISQPSLTRAVHELESELNVKLFIRLTRGMKPTPEGVELVERAKDILFRTQDAMAVVSDLSSGRAGEVRLGYTDDNQYGWLPDKIASFLKNNPQVQMHLAQDYSPTIAEQVARGELDIACVMPPLPPHLTDLESAPLEHMPLKLLVASDDPLAKRKSVKPQDIKGREVIVGALRPESGFYVQVMRALGSVRPDLTFRQGIYPTAMISNLVASGVGCSVVTDNSLSAGRDDVAAIPFKDNEMYVQTALIWRKNALNPASLQFKEYLLHN
ncbi:LysR family transcriptional regulator [Pseudomaricurvus alkylphenolicus]|uniref:LysR family transcriptional regulator n=1 Tax=Pseudomaricurvus alkylphenolicus TaxID=1306991 RepID=UPI00142132F3|nr:LysR family transcriptional regulator [Pseudomaricurvus alkylphenolicus]NIB45219.1 LysR family transcriptional regulator [Pseudomaricurvus alkylphenolicus]